MNDGFRVGSRLEPVPAREVPAVQLFEIVDFAVKNDPDRTILVRERLVAPFHVNNRQSAEPQTDAGTAIAPLVIRPPMADSVGHGLEYPGLEGGFTSGFEDAADPAHNLSSRHGRFGCLGAGHQTR